MFRVGLTRRMVTRGCAVAVCIFAPHVSDAGTVTIANGITGEGRLDIARTADGSDRTTTTHISRRDTRAKTR
jgi:hypothetical protein